MHSILLALAFATPGWSASAGGLAAGDALFDKGKYQEALSVYDTVAKKKDESGLRASYRAVECQALLFRYAEAATRVLALELPEDPVWQGRLLLLRAETERAYLAQYGYSLPTDEEKGSSDITKLTRRQWNEKINSAYDALWRLRMELAAKKLKNEGYFVDIKKVDFEKYPTLWDFAVTRWTGWLGELNGSDGAKADPLKFAVENYTAQYDAAAPAPLKAAAIYEGGGVSCSGRQAACDFHKITRLRIGLDWGLSSDTNVYNEASLPVLEKWTTALATPAARALAAFYGAGIYNQEGKYKQAVDLCDKGRAASASSEGGHNCAQLEEQIKAPQLTVTAKAAPPPGKDFLSLTLRNIDKAYLRAWRTTPAELASLNTGRGGRQSEFNYLRMISADSLDYFLSRKADFAWSDTVTYPGPYEYATKQSSSPELGKGIYVVAVSADSKFTAGASIMRGALVNITDIFIVGSIGVAGDPEDFLFDPANPSRVVDAQVMCWYGVNAVTGAPLKDAHLALRGGRNWDEYAETDLYTDAGGQAALNMPLQLAYRGSNNNIHQDSLLSYNGAFAWQANGSSFYFSPQTPLQVFIETDRPIYRPGQTVKFKATVLLRQPHGWKLYDGKSKVTITATDANGQQFFNKALPLNSMGSAAGEFLIPAGRLLGAYRLSASINEYGGSFSGACQLRTEEYKRPEFEVKLAAASGAFKYAQKARVEGEAKYYFGSPVPSAAVKYTITRKAFIPWYAWWWGTQRNENENEIARGEVTSGTDGKFVIDFVPSPETEATPWPSTYDVSVEAHDAGGRTISDTRSYRAGAKAYLFEMTPDAGFLTAGKKAVVSAKMLNLNEEQAEGAAQYKLCRVEGEPEKSPQPESWFIEEESRQSLENSYRNAKDGAQVAKGSLRMEKTGATEIKLPPLAEGVYRLTVSARDPWNEECSQSIILVSAAREGASKLTLPPSAIFEHASYQPGETARVLIGAGALKGAKFVEILAGANVLERRTLPSGGVETMAIKVSSAMPGGFGLHWFGATDFTLYSAKASAAVPWKSKELSVDMKYDAALAPGATANWSLSVKDVSGKPVSGEAVVRVYDRSLEYYMRDAGQWIAGLYSPRRSESPFHYTRLDAPGCDIPLRAGLFSTMSKLFHAAMGEQREPGLRLTQSRAEGFGGNRFMLKGISFAEGSIGSAASSLGSVAAMRGGAMDQEAKPSAPAPGGANMAADKKSMAMAHAEAPAPEVKVRSDFSETAYYNPQLPLVGGKGQFSFIMPERLTSWSVLAYALTHDVKRGSIAVQTVTRKDLMVRVDMPRFLREGDKGTIKAVVSNESENELSGEVALSISGADGDAKTAFALSDSGKGFSLKPHATQALAWTVMAPRGIAPYKVRAIARAGEYSDAQENDLPVLPSRQRLPATTIGVLDGNSKISLQLAELLKADPTREVESAHLQVDPQLALSVLNSLPSLVHYPYECTEQLLDRYVPLAIVNSFYVKYPQLSAAVGKIPKRETVTPAWDKDNPMRLAMLAESPWLIESDGRKSPWTVTDMLDQKLVDAQRASALEKLASYQNSDGSFPWFPGGKPDLYMTLLALDGFGEAARYGVPVRKDMASRALAYVNSEMPAHMKPAEGETSLLLYAAYVVTAFPNLPESKQAYANAKLWVDYADLHSNAMTAFGHAHAAYVYLRLGEKAKAENHLDRAMDGARKDPIAGVYWTPEKISWLWYNDSVEKHAFLLRTLLALRPTDERIPGMVQWLLFNRKGNEWKSTKASAAAIYSLLDVMKARGSLDKGDSFSVAWSGVNEKLETQPFDWLAHPVTYSLYGRDAADCAKATVSKKGPGLAFATLSAIYSTDMQAEESPSGMINVSRKYFLRGPADKGYSLTPLADGDTVHVGDQVEVHLTVNTRSQFEYVQLKDPRGAGFEGEELLSSWKWEKLSRYEEPRDSLTNFFMDWLPHGEYVLSYRMRPSSPGVYKIAPAVLQSMYAPEFAAHSAGMTLTVKE